VTGVQAILVLDDGHVGGVEDLERCRQSTGFVWGQRAQDRHVLERGCGAATYDVDRAAVGDDSGRERGGEGGDATLGRREGRQDSELSSATTQLSGVAGRGRTGQD